jgi:predicted DNA-binding ArsR family transcriptional regulator
MFAGDVSEQKELSMTMLKSLVKRSVKLEYRGHRVELVKEEKT